MNDPKQPNEALRRRAQQEYFQLGKDFLERGIKNNPDRPQLYESLARLGKEKLGNHLAASKYFALAAQRPGAPEYDKRFAAYELSYAPGHELEAYAKLLALYRRGSQERLPTLLKRLHFLEDKLQIPAEERIPPNEK